jgi:hypothetical protein
MDHKLLKDIMSMIISTFSCSLEKCMHTHKNINSNLKIKEQYNNALLEKDINKKKKLLTEVYKHKILYEHNKCIFTNCRTLYNKFFDIVEKIINNPEILKDKNKNQQIKKYLKDVKIILKSKNINIEKINTISKNFDIIGTLITRKN